MRNLKVWPHLTVIAIVVAIVAGLGVALWLKNERTASAEAVPTAARIQRVDGEVALSNTLDPNVDNAADAQWIQATANQPFSVGDRIYTRDNSSASLAFSGRNFARLHPNTGLDVVAIGDSRTQLALREGSAIFDIGYLPSGELFEVATPYGAVDFYEPGLYDMRIDDGAAIISVLSGLAQVVGLGGSGEISKGEVLRLVGQTAADVVLSQIDGRNAGYLVDDYYRYQYPNYYDGRYRDYNAYLDDPYYFDPYQRSTSYRYVSNDIPGFYDLDYYGDWQDINGYGYCWRPRVASGWTPYQQGYWMSDYPYGLTWVSTEPWGYAPYHYGRWAYLDNQWYWVPDRVNTTPLYSPALVAFLPFDNRIGWLPLGPGDYYTPRYYDTNWQPYYVTEFEQPRFVNLGVPGAVTVVTVDQFGRIIDSDIVRTVDSHVLAQVRPELEPLRLTPLRNAVINSAWGRGKIDLPPGIAKKLVETRVVTSSLPPAPPFRRDLARRLRVETVSEKAKDQKLKVRDERRGGDRASEGRFESPRRDQREIPVGGAAQERELRKQARQPEREQTRQQRVEQRQQRRAAERPAPVRPQGERVANPGRSAERSRRPQEGPQPRQRVERPRPERRERPQARATERPRPVRSVQQPAQRVAERPRPVRQERAQPQPRAAERPRPVRQERVQPQPRAVERRGAAAQRQGPQQQVKSERKQSPPAAKSQSQGGGGKGKGRKP